MKIKCKMLLLAFITLSAAGYIADTSHAAMIDVSLWNGSDPQIRRISMINGVGSDLGTIISGLSEPLGVAIDNAGTLYVADAGTNTIYKKPDGGSVSTFANTGLDLPLSLAFDASGNLYASNTHSFQFTPGYIEKFTPSGVGSFFAATDNDPGAMAFDNAGNLYVGNANSNTISKITPSGSKSTFVTTDSYPGGGLAFDSAGNLYASIFFANVIRKYSASGQDLGVFASINGPGALALDSDGNLYVGNYPGNSISEFSSNGTLLGSFGLGASPGYFAIEGASSPAAPAAVPEASTWMAGIIGMLAVVVLAKRRTQRHA